MKLSTALLALLVLLSTAQAVPISLPSILPNVTQYTSAIDAAKASIQDAVQSAVNATIASALKTKPFTCLNKKPLVFCPWAACAGKCASASQTCVPNVCGDCAPICLNMTLPAFEIAVPALKSASWRIPSNFSAFPECKGNTVIDVSRTFFSMIDNPGTRCKACPSGTVAAAGVSCVLCPPATAIYTNATTGALSCRLCAKGYASAAFGAKSCKACPAGTFAPVPGSLACFKCPPGFSSGVAASTCTLNSNISLFG